MQNLSIITPVGTKKRYLNVLKKCFLLNIMMLGVITLSTIAKAETAETTLTPSEELETVVYDSSNFSRTTISSDTTIDLAGKNLTYSGIESSASGGVFHVNSDKTLEFINSDETTDPLLLFENNTATKYGRAISNYGDVTFDSESSFISNSSDLGGAILNYGYIMFNEVAIFSNNSGLSYGVGGAIYNDYGSTITFGEGSTAIFSGNTASDGGAIDNFGDITFGGEATTFTNNSAGSVGGAIYNGGSITFGGETTFTNNSAGSVGGAIDNGEGSIIFYGETIFSENEASVGGAICNDGTITFDNKATFTDNSANYGGAIENYAYNSNATITFGEVSTATFSGNEASQYGGAIENYADNSDVNATITFGEGSSATFMGTRADVGGAIE